MSLYVLSMFVLRLRRKRSRSMVNDFALGSGSQNGESPEHGNLSLELTDTGELFHENSKNPFWTKKNSKASQIHYEKHILELVSLGPKTYNNRRSIEFSVDSDKL